MAKNLEKWREYFKSANSDIFDIIEYGVMVAAVDCPKEFKLRRDGIAEMLFTCKLTKCFGCDKVELSVPTNDDDVGDVGHKCKAKESKTSSSRDDDNDQIEMNVNQISNYSYGEAEALTDEIEEESQTFGEVLRIKHIIQNFEDESKSLIFESLRRLQLMALSVETLKDTEIGKCVNALRKHGSKNIRNLARTLVDDWKTMVEEWVNATAAFTGTGSTPESVKASVVDEEEEEGLPSPPLEDLAFVVTQTTGIELSQFFDGMDDGMDDYGNPRNSGNKSRDNGRKPTLENKNVPLRKPQFSDDFTAAPKDRKIEQPKRQEALVKKQTAVVMPNNRDSGPGRLIKPPIEQKLNNNEIKSQQKSVKGTIQKRPVVPSQQNRLRCSDEGAADMKLEAAKRKLQERYQEVENAKRQRTVQVMELHDIPKQKLGHKTNMRPGSLNRFPNGRR